MHALGVLGALDPHHAAELEAVRSGAAGPGVRERSAADVMPGVGTSPDNYYPAAAFTALTAILRDPSLSMHHMAAVQAVMYIVHALGTRVVAFLPEVMPPFLGLLRTCEPGLRDFMFQQLGDFVSIVRSHIRPHLQEITTLIRESWHSPLLVAIVKLVEEISRVLADDFKVYLPELIPPLLNVLATDRVEGRAAALRVLRALEALGSNLDDYLYLVVPAVVRLAEQAEAPLNVRQAALSTLAKLCRRLNVADYAARIVHPLMRILGGHWPDLRREAMEVR
jgi:FKBP12-rapamycin complex-associated protein